MSNFKHFSVTQSRQRVYYIQSGSVRDRHDVNADVRVEGSPEYAGALGSFMVRVQDLLTPPAK